MPHLTECNRRLEKVSKLPGASPLPHFWVSLEPRRPPCTSFGRARPAPGSRSVDSLGSVRNPLPSDVLTLAPSAPPVSTHRSPHQKGLPRLYLHNVSRIFCYHFRESSFLLTWIIAVVSQLGSLLPTLAHFGHYSVLPM